MLQISGYASQTSALESLPELVKIQIPGLHLRVSESVGLLTGSQVILGIGMGGRIANEPYLKIFITGLFIFWVWVKQF